MGRVEQAIAQIRKGASLKASMVCWAGSSVVLAQFMVIFWGTFQVLSWDIMEPVCYLMTFGNFTGGFFFYTMMKKDLDLTNFHEILTERFTLSACKR